MIITFKNIIPKYFASFLLVILTASISIAQDDIISDEPSSELYEEISEYQKNLTDTYSDEDTSILSEEDRLKFIAAGGHPFFPVDTSYHIDADLTVYPQADKIEFKTSTTRIANYNIYGKASFRIAGKDFELFVYQDASPMSQKLYKDHLFVPFTDLTSGEETYGGGRYLDLMIPEDKTKIIIDFNKAYHPYCAYTDGYSCPIPPVDNFIDHRIEAGIKHLDIKGLITSSAELLDKSIAYHDPNNNWKNFDATLLFKTIMADSSERRRTVRINNKKNTFYFDSQYEEGRLEYHVKNNLGTAKWNGNSTIPKEMSDKYRISDDRAVMYRNYYTYLYGMPMKLSDPGAIIDPSVKRVEFYGKSYDRIKVNYDPEVGSDTWYFYFNTKTHALEAYQFFKDESKNDGEYILFEETKVIDGIKIPSIRHWYYNDGQKFLATDVIE